MRGVVLVMVNLESVAERFVFLHVGGLVVSEERREKNKTVKNRKRERRRTGQNHSGKEKD
jgi:hypothetical protein